MGARHALQRPLDGAMRRVPRQIVEPVHFSQGRQPAAAVAFLAKAWAAASAAAPAGVSAGTAAGEGGWPGVWGQDLARCRDGLTRR
jgi:hypothetical protein